MAISTMDGVVAGLAVGQIIPFYKASASTKGAGYFHSLWKGTGFPTAASTPPTGTGEAPTNATLGAIPITNAGSGKKLYVGRASMSAVTIGHFMLYDRLVHTSGLDGTSTALQTVNSTPLTRYTTGEGCQLFVEFYVATGSIQANITVAYTNQTGASKSTTTSLTPTASPPTVGQMTLISLAAGDTGVRSVESITLSGTTGVIGSFGITIGKPLMDFPITLASGSFFMDAIACGLPEVKDDACLALYVLCSTTNSGNINGQFTLIEG